MVRKIQRELSLYAYQIKLYCKKFPIGLFIVFTGIISLAKLSIYCIKPTDASSYKYHLTSTSLTPLLVVPPSTIPSPLPCHPIRSSGTPTPQVESNTSTISELVQLLGHSTPGVLFTIVLAIITTCGFLISLNRIEELLGRVMSLDDFLDFSTRILKNAKEKGLEVWISCHSPLIGNLSLRNSEDQHDYVESLLSILCTPSRKNPIHILSFDVIALRNYYLNFGNDSRFDHDSIRKGFEELEQIYATTTFPHVEMYGTKIKNIDPFFLVATRKEAVVATPLFLPAQGQNTDMKKKSHGVELVGFYTHDTAATFKLIEAMEAYCESATKLKKNAMHEHGEALDYLTEKLKEIKNVSSPFEAAPENPESSTYPTNGKIEAVQTSVIQSAEETRLPTEPEAAGTSLNEQSAESLATESVANAITDDISQNP